MCWDFYRYTAKMLYWRQQNELTQRYLASQLETNPAPDRPGRMRHPLLLTRSAAVRLLVAYLGALSQSLYAANAFVEQAYNCYRSRLPRWDRV